MSEDGDGAPPFDCIGFDLDGTLLHTGRELAAALNHVLTGSGHDAVETERAIAMIGGGARALLARALASQGETRQDVVDALLPRLIDHYAANLGRDTDIYPGLEDALDALAGAGVELAVVTNKGEALSRRLLEIKGLAARFALIIGGDTLGEDRKKPKPDMLLHMAREMGAKRPLLVGDSEYDIGAAMAAEIPVVAVSFGYATEDLAALGAAHIIDHYDALLPMLRGWR